MTADGTPRSPTLDPDAVRSLVELVGDDREALLEIVDAFVEEAPERLAEVRQGIDTGDIALVRRAAHTLKANGQTFGADKLARLCQEIEAAARAGDLQPAAMRIHELDEAWIDVSRELVQLRNGPP